MSPHGRKPHANAFVAGCGRDSLEPVVAPVHAHRAHDAAIGEGLVDAFPPDALECLFSDGGFCSCGHCGDMLHHEPEASPLADTWPAPPPEHDP